MDRVTSYKVRTVFSVEVRALWAVLHKQQVTPFQVQLQGWAYDVGEFCVFVARVVQRQLEETKAIAVEVEYKPQADIKAAQPILQVCCCNSLSVLGVMLEATIFWNVVATAK